MKFKQVFHTGTAAIVAAVMLAACGSSGGGTTATTQATADNTQTTAAADTTTQASSDTTAATDTTAAADNAQTTGEGGRVAPPEGKDTNNGRPYNLSLVNYDGRKDIYLNGINATILPIVDQPTTINIWLPFSSTVVTDVNDTEVFKALKERTGITVN